MLQKLLQHQADQPPDLRQFRPELPEDVNRILRKMLAKDPRHRYASPVELVNDLLWVARAAGLRPAAPGGRTWTVPISPVVPFYYRHLPWVVSLLALVAIVVALEYLWPYLPGPAAPLHAPAPTVPDDSSPRASPAPPPGVGPITSAHHSPFGSGAVKPIDGPSPDSVLPISPNTEIPLGALSPASSTAPARDAAAEKSVVPLPRPANDDSRNAVPKDAGSPGG
jgi:serine/threonine-protein kinase